MGPGLYHQGPVAITERQMTNQGNACTPRVCHKKLDPPPQNIYCRNILDPPEIVGPPRSLRETVVHGRTTFSQLEICDHWLKSGGHARRTVDIQLPATRIAPMKIVTGAPWYRA